VSVAFPIYAVYFLLSPGIFPEWQEDQMQLPHTTGFPAVDRFLALKPEIARLMADMLRSDLSDEDMSYLKDNMAMFWLCAAADHKTVLPDIAKIRAAAKRILQNYELARVENQEFVNTVKLAEMQTKGRS